MVKLKFMLLKEYNPYLEYKNGELFLEGVSLKELAKEYGTPLYVYSASYIRDRIRAYKEAFPNALICYAVKANFNPHIVAIAKEEGAGADVVSGGELYCALKAGVEPSKIVYAGVGKTLQEITFAVEKDILMFNVESHMELDVLNEVGERLGKKVRVAIRVNPDVDPKDPPLHLHRHEKKQVWHRHKAGKGRIQVCKKLEKLGGGWNTLSHRFSNSGCFSLHRGG
jgi:diaminopimelate decarboxylase